MLGKLVPDPFSEKSKLGISRDQLFEMSNAKFS